MHFPVFKRREHFVLTVMGVFVMVWGRYGGGGGKKTFGDFDAESDFEW